MATMGMPRRGGWIGGALLAVAMVATATPAEDPVAVVRARRAESNAAIAAHDGVRLRALFDEDYHAILGSTGAVDSGAEAATRGYVDEEFRDPTFVTYRRTPDAIRLAASGRRIAESGRFEGTWRKPDGLMRRSGVYLAMWVPSNGSWRLKSESFVTLACSGSVACEPVR